MPITYQNSREMIKKAWDACELDTDPSKFDIVDTHCKKMILNHKRYDAIANQLGCPWWFPAVLHGREASFNFNTCFHNGDPLPGPTRNVPKGRGPFSSWEESAIDALKLKSYGDLASWSIYRFLYEAERFNGFGYRTRTGDSGRVELSPYVWAYTNQHDETSKYVSDGRYDSTAREKQPGVASYLKYFEKYGLAHYNYNEPDAPVTPPPSTPEPKPTTPTAPPKKSFWQKLRRLFGR